MEPHSRGCRGPSGGRFLARGKRSRTGGLEIRLYRRARALAPGPSVRRSPGRGRAGGRRSTGRARGAPVALEARRNSVHRCTSSTSSIGVGRAGQGREGAQEAAVGLVLPRHRALPAPASAAQRVEPAVVAGAGVGVRRRRRGGRPGRPRRARPRPARTPGGRRRPARVRSPLARASAAGSSGRCVGGMPSRSELTGCLQGRSGWCRSGAGLVVESREHAARGAPHTACSLTLDRSGSGGCQPGQPWWVPAERRFWQASTTRAAMPASASLPHARGSYCFLLPTSPSIFSTPV